MEPLGDPNHGAPPFGPPRVFAASPRSHLPQAEAYHAAPRLRRLPTGEGEPRDSFGAIMTARVVTPGMDLGVGVPTRAARRRRLLPRRPAVLIGLAILALVVLLAI